MHPWRGARKRTASFQCARAAHVADTRAVPVTGVTVIFFTHRPGCGSWLFLAGALGKSHHLPEAPFLHLEREGNTLTLGRQTGERRDDSTCLQVPQRLLAMSLTFPTAAPGATTER